jgi:glycosyltransferase involved in cell wall biosynthesis
MQIAIVIPAWNVAPFIGQAIRSVLAQSYKDWVLTVIDDGSTDATAAAALDAIAGDPRAQMIRQANAGVSTARNAGMNARRADATLFLDGDDWLAPGALAALAAELERAPDAVAVSGPWQRLPSGDGMRAPPSGDLLPHLLVRNLFVNGGHLLIRRWALEAAGRFDPGLRFGEDWEYWVRLACLGPFAACRAPEPLLFVRERADGAYLSMAARRASFTPCLDAIFGGALVRSRIPAAALALLRARADAESDWIAGRELLRHGRVREGWPYLLRSVHAAPGARRLALLAMAGLPFTRRGPFRRYRAPGLETICNK